MNSVAGSWLHPQCPKTHWANPFPFSYFFRVSGEVCSSFFFFHWGSRNTWRDTSEDDTGLNVTLGQQVPEATVLTFFLSELRFLCCCFFLLFPKSLRNHEEKKHHLSQYRFINVGILLVHPFRTVLIPAFHIMHHQPHFSLLFPIL